jgi:ubiquinone/menaquinone biosynthesis C-methylase UbiE
MYSEKWETAQNHEKLFWFNLSRSIKDGTRDQLYWYNWKAQKILDMLKEKCCLNIQDNDAVLEIGSGPVGIVSKLCTGQRYAIDPLEKFYKTKDELTKLRDPAVQFLDGKGEELPFDDEFFEFVIMDNILDHAENPNNILSEVYRVLKPGKVLYLGLNTRTFIGSNIHVLLSLLGIDKKHPHSYTVKTIRKTLSQSNFDSVYDCSESVCTVIACELKTKNIKNYIKAATFQTEIYYENLSLRA